MIKYRIPYKSYDNSDWLIEFDIIGYTGAPINVRGVADRVGVLSYDGGVDDLWDNPLVNVSLTSAIYNQGQIDQMEFLTLNDRDCKITVTRNGQVKFQGYLIPDNQQIRLASIPYEMEFGATSGLPLLETLQFSVFGAELGSRCPLNYFRKILMQQLGINLPIRWSCSIEAINTSISGEPFQNLRWSQFGDGFLVNPTTGNMRYQSCKYIVEGLTKALQCRIVQADGAWWVIGIKEHLADVIAYRECANSTGLPVITEHTRDSARVVGDDYKFINEDAVLTTTAGNKSVTVTYEHNQFANILPNGGLDQRSLGALMWWGVQGGTFAYESETGSITGRGGSAVKLINPGPDPAVFKLINPLPIDAHTLYNIFEFGFSFMAIDGYPLNPENGRIDWRNNEIKVSVKYTVNNNGTIEDWYLNEYGYWQNTNGPANQQVISTSWHPAGNAFYIHFDPAKSFFTGDVVFIQFVRDGVVIGREVLFEETMDVTSGVAFIVSKIQDGYTSGSSNLLTINNTQDHPANTAWTEKEADYFKYISFTVQGLELNYSAAITYTGAGSLENKIIDPGVIDLTTGNTEGLLSVEFVMPAGKTYVLDDIWLSVNHNKDVYKASHEESNNTKNLDISLPISSAFSGFYTSNLMRSYSTSNTDWLFTDGTDIGSLTELYARSALRCLYSQNIVFNGSISTRGKDWSFIDNYSIATLDGKKFLPNRAIYNTEKNEVNLIALEYRNDDIAISIEHYGSEEERGLKY